MWVQHAPTIRNWNEITLFSFDDHAFPFQRFVMTEVIGFPRRGAQSPKGPVVAMGEDNAPDANNVAYYGTVRKVGNEYWMWYLGSGKRDPEYGDQWFQRLCLAKSTDGKTWVKPDLGLVNYKGNTNNNLCDFPLGDHLQACVVFYEPDEADPNKVFKMSFESRKYKLCMGVAFSPDGLHWTEYEGNPVGDSFFEQAGGAKRDGLYFVTGQGHVGHYDVSYGRKLVTYCSRDFIHWTPAAALGYSRNPQPPKPIEFGAHNGRQVHLGAGLWDRGNVVLGFYGMWHGHPSNDRNMLYMHLGLLVTHDLLHYTEPVPDFPIVAAGELKNDTKAHAHFPAIMQGQGFENIGDETLFWFGLWPEVDSDGVHLAVWERDRLGCIRPFTGPDEPSFIISDAIHFGGDRARLFLNVSGIKQYSGITVTLLDDNFEPVEGYTNTDCDAIAGDGLRVPVRWRGDDIIKGCDTVRLRVNFTGIRPEEVKLYAAYVEKAE